MNGSARKNWVHLALVCLLLIVQFFVRDILGLYYRSIERRHLISVGAQPCSAYLSPLPDEKLQPCDLVLVSGSGGALEEHFYSPRGDIVKIVSSRGGKLIRNESSLRAVQVALVIPLFGFALGFVAMLRHSVRTRSWFTWQIERQGADRVERLLFLYAAPLFLSGILFTVLGR